MKIIASSADNLYRATLKQILQEGKPVAPRGQHTTEVVGAHLVLHNPDRNIITLPERALNYHFLLAEWLWITLGYNTLEMIQPYNQNVAQFTENATFRGAYGPKYVEQLPYVRDVLHADPYSRQAIIDFWRERPRASKDVPCTLSMQFIMRDDGNPIAPQFHLDLIVTMRSNDAWWGLPYDLFTFTMIQQQVASLLQVQLGTYHHFVGSLHIYDRHLEAVEKVVMAGDTIVTDRVHVVNEPLPLIPAEFKAYYTGITLLGPRAQSTAEMKTWLRVSDELPAPWNAILGVLGHRFHGDHSLLDYPWNALIPRLATK